MTEILDDNFASLYITKNKDWDSDPIIKLNSSEQLDIYFDCLSDDIVDQLYYRVKFCNYDWSINTTLLESEYLDGINSVRIYDFENSLNTTTLYTNYSFSFPNKDLTPKLPGNYLIEVFNSENENITILTAQVYVVMQDVDIKSSSSTQSVLGNNTKFQQLDIEVSYKTNTTNPSEDYKVVVTQNNRLDNIVRFPTPNFLQPNKLVFSNNNKLAFDAGNEYFRFDTSSGQMGGMGIEHIEFKNQLYHFHLAEKTLDYPNTYHYDQTQQGKVIYRMRDNKDIIKEGDYFWVYFSFNSDKKIPNREVYINGDFTYQSFSPKYKLIYDPLSEKYHIALLLKQGIYNYQYLIRNELGNFCNLQGDFYQTKNSYRIYVYFFDKMSRYDQLVGYKKI